MLLEPDRKQIAAFTETIFRHVGEGGFVAVRSFQDDDSNIMLRQTPTKIVNGLSFLIDVAVDDARRAANEPRPAVFCPPLATFICAGTAKEADIREGLALTVECDRIQPPLALHWKPYSAPPLP